MIIIHVITAFIVALILTTTLMRVFGRRGPGPAAGFIFFFLLLFVFAWASATWLTPYGPTVAGAAWLQILFATLFLMLVLAAMVPPSPTHRVVRRNDSGNLDRIPSDEEPTDPAKEAIVLTFTAFFWVALVGLLVVTILRSFY